MNDASVQTAHAALGPARPALCPSCAYSLVGLPDDAVCPECGEARHVDLIVVYGYAYGAFADVTTVHRRGLRVAIAWLVIGCLPAMLVFSGTLSLVALATCIIAVTTLFWARGQNEHPGTLQARFNVKGCAQHSNVVDPLVRTIMVGAVIFLNLWFVIFMNLHGGIDLPRC